MKKLITITFFVFTIFSNTYSQTTTSPTCTTNATGWTIESIVVSDYSTSVKFKVYYSKDTKFLIHPSMYIQKYNYTSGTKYYISEFVSNETNTWYTADAYTTYHFTLKFSAIPKGLTNISIFEPVMEGANPWYFKNITISNPVATTYSSESTMDNYFKYQGVKLLASLAHPTNTYKSGSYIVYDDKIWVDIIYVGYETTIEVERVGNFFTDITILYDNDWIDPFEAIATLKDLAYEAFKDESTNKSAIEKKIGKTFSEMNGKQMACLILTLDWLDY